MKKRFVCILLALCMAASLLPAPALAADLTPVNITLGETDGLLIGYADGAYTYKAGTDAAQVFDPATTELVVTTGGAVRSSDSSSIGIEASVPADAELHIRLSDCKLSQTGDSSSVWNASSKANVVLTLVGENLLEAGVLRPALRVPAGSTYRVLGTGSLKVSGGAAIGDTDNTSTVTGGVLAVESGTIDFDPTANLVLLTRLYKGAGTLNGWYGTTLPMTCACTGTVTGSAHMLALKDGSAVFEATEDMLGSCWERHTGAHTYENFTVTVIVISGTGAVEPTTGGHAFTLTAEGEYEAMLSADVVGGTHNGENYTCVIPLKVLAALSDLTASPITTETPADVTAAMKLVEYETGKFAYGALYSFTAAKSTSYKIELNVWPSARSFVCAPGDWPDLSNPVDSFDAEAGKEYYVFVLGSEQLQPLTGTVKIIGDPTYAAMTPADISVGENGYTEKLDLGGPGGEGVTGAPQAVYISSHSRFGKLYRMQLTEGERLSVRFGDAAEKTDTVLVLLRSLTGEIDADKIREQDYDNLYGWGEQCDFTAPATGAYYLFAGSSSAGPATLHIERLHSTTIDPAAGENVYVVRIDGQSYFLCAAQTPQVPADGQAALAAGWEAYGALSASRVLNCDLYVLSDEMILNAGKLDLGAGSLRVAQENIDFDIVGTLAIGGADLAQECEVNVEPAGNLTVRGAAMIYDLDVYGGSLLIERGGSVTINSDGDMDIYDNGTVINRGRIAIPNDELHFSSGSFQNDGVIDCKDFGLFSKARFQNNGALRVSNELFVSGALQNDGVIAARFLSVDEGGVLDNRGELRAGFTALGTPPDTGTMYNRAGGVMELDGLTVQVDGSALINAGTLTINSFVDLYAGHALVNSGTVTNEGLLLTDAADAVSNTGTLHGGAGSTSAGLFVWNGAPGTTDAQLADLLALGVRAKHSDHLDFSAETGEQGSLDTDGYHWDGGTKTLTLRSLYALGSITLPAAGATIKLEGGSAVSEIVGLARATATLTVQGPGTLLVNDPLTVDALALTGGAKMSVLNSVHANGVSVSGGSALSIINSKNVIALELANGASTVAVDSTSAIRLSGNPALRLVDGANRTEFLAAHAGLIPQNARFEDKNANTALLGANGERIRMLTLSNARTVVFLPLNGEKPVLKSTPAGGSVTAPSVSRGGYSFDGWHTADGAAYDFSTPVTRDLVLFAGWSESSGGGRGDTVRHTITATAGAGGAITPSGAVRVAANGEQTFAIAADEGYVIADVLVDGVSVGAVRSYTFERVRKNHSIEASFRAVAWDNPFGDVPAGSWFYEAVGYVCENQLFQGVSATSFAPNESMTRAMLATVLYRIAGEPAAEGTALSAFGDSGEVPAWALDGMRWAVQTGVMTGRDGGTLDPNGAVTREQLVTMLYRYAQYRGDDVSAGEDTNILSYRDAADLAEYAVPAMQWACGAGLVSGTPEGELQSGKNATRAEVAAILMRFCMG